MKKFIKALRSAKYACRFIMNNVGKEYGITSLHKLKLILKIVKNYTRIKSLSDPLQLLIIIEEIFKIPKTLEGDVVECGCYDGASTASLSLACYLTKRKLLVCDSFEGLPIPQDDEKYDVNANNTDKYYLWEEGEFSSEGGLEGVKKNITKYGDISVCEFVKGYYNETLKEINTNLIVLIFEDADIASSVKDCLCYLWSKLQDGCKFYCHEPWSTNVVSLFYDKNWWQENFYSEPPGFFGSGEGIVRAGLYTNIGYTRKIDVNKVKEHGQKKMHKGSKGFEDI
ncbi:hypothetical protein ES705_22205 [subsurface metagenome]